MKNLFFIGIITLAFVGCKSDQMLSFRVCNEETKKRYLKVDFDEIIDIIGIFLGGQSITSIADA